jgi:ABC-type polysaccharide/polyol phosphate transport system ATPase subunit
MAYINVENITVDLPILGHSGRSMRKLLVNIGTGGKLMKAGDDRIVVRAIQDVSFEVNKGDRLGLCGHNGCGKTTLLRVLAGIYEPTLGKVDVRGRISSLLDTTFGLNVDATGRENIKLLLTYRRIPPQQIAALQPVIEEFTELGSYLDLPVRTYSAGMFARLAFAVATSFDPEILIMDEWLMAGDAAFMKKAEDRIDEFVNKASIVVIATHSEDLIRRVCNKVLKMEQGKVVQFGLVDEVLGPRPGSPPPVAQVSAEPAPVAS